MTTDTDDIARPGEDIFWHFGRKETLPRVYEEYRQTRDALESAGLDALYGGTKGHGFWIRGHEKDDDGETGNRHFWSIGECRELLAAKEQL